MKQPRIRRILERAFNGLEIVDAKKGLLLFPTQEDFDKATRMDPLHCGFANCVARACGSSQAHFFKRYVYIDHFGDDGKRRVYRYVVSRSVFRAISAFDRGNKVRVNKAFALRAPGPSETIKAHRDYNKKWKASDTYKAIKKEQKARGELRVAEKQLEKETALAKSTDAVPGSAKARDSERRLTAAKTQLVKARDALTVATKRAKEMRKATYGGTGKAAPRKKDLNVRSGTGTWLQSLQAA